MSDVKVVSYLLAHNAPLVAAVPSEQILTGLIPQGSPLPAVCVTHVSTTRPNPIKAENASFCISRVQITVLAASYVQQKAVRDLVRAALPRTRGSVNGVAVDSLVDDIDGPDFRDDQAGLFMQTLDYIVRYNE